MLQGFKTFIMRGNVIDLAVAFVIGAAFSTLVGAFTKALINPIVGIFLGGGFNAGTLTIRDQVIDFSLLINSLITFFITLVVVYFVFVVPMNTFRKRTAGDEEVVTPDDIKVLQEIRDLLQEQSALLKEQGEN
ncbi:MAG: large conductance mechanosensitive channel protein MscL [Actinomycetota bacterium]|nr:large conductance mechanosensitive channel protein MscL [Actinomycetota bacterium]